MYCRTKIYGMTNERVEKITFRSWYFLVQVVPQRGCRVVVCDSRTRAISLWRRTPWFCTDRLRGNTARGSSAEVVEMSRDRRRSSAARENLVVVRTPKRGKKISWKSAIQYMVYYNITMYYVILVPVHTYSRGERTRVRNRLTAARSVIKNFLFFGIVISDCGSACNNNNSNNDSIVIIIVLYRCSIVYIYIYIGVYIGDGTRNRETIF